MRLPWQVRLWWLDFSIRWIHPWFSPLVCLFRGHEWFVLWPENDSWMCARCWKTERRTRR